MRLCTSALLFLASAAAAQSPPADLTLTQIQPAGTFSNPLAIRHAGDDSGRIFIVQKGGTIRVFNTRTNTLLATPFLTIPVSTSSEQGLLGLAFHPNYDGVNERRFYVAYTVPSGHPTLSAGTQALAEFSTFSANPNAGDPGSRREVMAVLDMASNHNGGDIVFGPDDMLYWSMGDGGPQNDPSGFAQCLWRKPQDNTPTNCSPGGGTNYALLGKIIRIDPTTPTASATSEMCAATAGQPAGYSIPADNPYVGSSNTCDEIVHYGMRNPWRISFDRLNGDLYIADVGQGTWEETTRVPAGQFGRNLGWRCFEGTAAFNSTGPCATNPLPNRLDPFQTYQHVNSPNGEFRCSITGGYRYRGPIEGLRGMYISADYCSGEIYFASFNGSTWSPGLAQVNIWRDEPYNIAGFGEDEQGNVYVGGYTNGALYRITSASDNSAIFEFAFEG